MKNPLVSQIFVEKMTTHPVESGARAKVFHYTFASAAQSNYELYLTLEHQLHVDSEGKKNSPESTILGNKLFIAGVETIVFSAMCFEAAIFDYAAWQLGDGYTNEHLSKLDLVSKWIVLPKLICGVELKKDRAPFAALNKLVKARNRLVHHRSVELNFEDQAQLRRLENESRQFNADVHNAFRALVLMSLEMENLLGGFFNPLPSYSNKGISWPQRFDTPEIATLISNCKRIVGSSCT